MFEGAEVVSGERYGFSVHCLHFWTSNFDPKSKQMANFRCKKTCLNYISNKGKTKFGIDFLEESSRFFAIRARSTPPPPGSSLSENSFLQKLCFFIGKIFTFLKKILYKHGNLKYLNNFHTFLGLQKAKFDS